MRLNPRVFIKVLIPTAMLLLILSYQNFSDVAPSEWDGQTALKVIHEMQDFERTDPGLRPELAVPEGGHDFESVRNNWAERQSKILLNGFDKRVEDAVNDRLNSYLRALTSRDAASESSTPKAEPLHATRTMAAIDPTAGEPAASGIPENLARPVNTNASIAAETPRPRNALKFPRPNAIRYEFTPEARLDLIANPGDTRLNYSQAYNERTKVGVEHSTSGQQTQMYLRYEW
jgi:hypothetical protein